MPTHDMHALRRLLVRYQRPDAWRSIAEILFTVVPLASLWTGAMWAALAGVWWAALALTIPAAAFVLRLFAIQHDCGHRSLFVSARLNDWIGRTIGVITLTPFDCWKREHAIHHATSGDLDRRDLGSVLTLTVDEYLALRPLQRLGYRLYRHPAVLFFIGPVFVFFVQQRLPVGLMREGWRPWVSAIGTNLAVLLIVSLAIWLGVWPELLLVYVPTVMIAAAIGVWMFFVQHQFEGAHWMRHDGWNHTEAGLRGSSHYELPQPLRWLTANIGVHHVHHIASRIPFYDLPRVLRDHPDLKAFGRVTLSQSLNYTKLALWDEPSARLISFRELRNLQ